jgi:hypothetical protein
MSLPQTADNLPGEACLNTVLEGFVSCRGAGSSQPQLKVPHDALVDAARGLSGRLGIDSRSRRCIAFKGYARGCQKRIRTLVAVRDK